MSSKQVTVITCNGCNKVIDSKTNHIHICANEDHWLNFEYGGKFAVDVYDLDFCNTDCLTDWIEREVMKS